MKRRTLTKGLIIAVMIAMIAAAGLLVACGETTYTVRFDAGGGSLVDSQTVNEGGTATEPEPPTRDGYTFAGWYTDSEFTQEFSFSQPITSNITLYAKWVEGSYTPGGGDTPGGEDTPGGGDTPGLEYTLNDEGTAYSVTGIGTATDTNIVIASEYNGLPVTSISDYAFEREMDITSVFIPGSVKTIGVSAFGDCYALRKVILNEGLISIAWYAFGAEDDGILSEVNLPSTLQEIGDAAFCGTALTQITIPKSVTVIDEYAFMESASLTIYCEEESKPEGWAQTWNEDEQPVVWGCKNNDIADDGNLYYVDENNLRYSLKEDGTAELVRQSEGLSVVENIPQKITYNGKGYDVTTIKSDAFEDSSVLSKIVIPSSITTIEGAAISSFISTVVYCETAAKPAGWDKNWTSTPIVWDYKNNDIADDGNLYVFQNDIRFVLNDGEAAVSGEQRKDIIDAVIPENIQYGTESYVVTRIDDFDDTYTLRSMSLPSTLEYVNLGLWHNSFGEVEKIYISDWGSFLNIEFDGYEISNPLYYSENVYVGGELCDGNVIIPSSVTAIKDYALCWSGLTSITIPDSVTSISEHAFSGTKLIQKENGVSYVDKWVVDCDSSLTQVQLYDNTAGIADSAFGYCDLLTSIVIPDSVVSIGNSAFTECSALSSVTLGGGIISIGDNAFEDCIALTSISIPNSVTSIGEYAFSGCNGLTNITIPNSVTSIGEYAFSGCNGLTNITIPNSVTSIGEGAFFYNDSLTSITLDQGNANYYFAGNCLIETDSKTLIVGSESSVIPDDGSVTRIGNSAFSDCSGLTSIVIPDSVTSIGDYAFSSCDSLTSIVIPDSVTSIGDRAFSSCSSLTSIVIPDSVTSIGDSAFSGCSGLTSITIPNSVTSIGDSAFSGCSGLTSIVIPDSVTSIGSYAFQSCSSLKEVHISDIAAWCKINFAGISSNPLYYTENIYLNDELITQLEIPRGVTSIGDYAFSGCSGLMSITIPDSVTSIGDYAFSGCSGLMSITIPDSVTSIGDSAFSGCSGLMSITIPDSVTSIGDYAFSGCSSLTSIVIPDSVTSIGSYAFQSCSSLASIVIPDSVTSIGDSAFYICTGLTSITIPDSVTYIRAYAFAFCNSLENITFQGTMEQWNAIYKEAYWNYSTDGSFTITCTDGILDKDGNQI